MPANYFRAILVNPRHIRILIDGRVREAIPDASFARFDDDRFFRLLILVSDDQFLDGIVMDHTVCQRHPILVRPDVPRAQVAASPRHLDMLIGKIHAACRGSPAIPERRFFDQHHVQCFALAKEHDDMAFLFDRMENLIDLHTGIPDRFVKGLEFA